MSTSSLGQTESDRLVNRLRNTNGEKFQTMVKMHLTFLLDLPGSKLQEVLSPAEDTRRKRGFFRRKVKECSKNSNNSDLFGGALTTEAIHRISNLIEFLKKPEVVKTEGLFRKNGNCGRQKLLREKLCSRETLHLEDGSFSAHDCAGVLKHFLGELPEPLLTERLYPAYCQIPGITNEDEVINTGDNSTQKKQIETLQLLFQLLPKENYMLLKCILRLLHIVACENANKMTASTLATIFAPHVLVPRKMSASDLQISAPTITKIVSFMIGQSLELFKIPDQLMIDIRKYWEEMEMSGEGRPDLSPPLSLQHTCCNLSAHKKILDTEAVYTSVAFADRAASQRADANMDTQMQLAELYAHVSAMPEGSNKRRLMKQFNKANGVGTPANIQYTGKKHKRSKSLGESIKKHVLGHGRNHRRKASGQSVKTSVIPLSFTERPQFHHPLTPEIRSPLLPKACASPSNNIPMAELFKRKRADIQEAAVNANSPVHIVDLKLSSENEGAGRKRKLGRCASVKVRPNNSCPCGYSTGKNCENCSLPGTLIPETPFLHKLNKYTKGTPVKASHLIHPSSPISMSVRKAPKSLQDSVMTPRSRIPLAMVQTP